MLLSVVMVMVKVYEKDVPLQFLMMLMMILMTLIVMTIVTLMVLWKRILRTRVMVMMTVWG